MIKTALLSTLAVSALTLGAAAQEVTGDDIVDAIEKRNGQPYEGYRRVHAKGMCGAGSFVGSGEGTALSEASLFGEGIETPVVFRFSDPNGNPFISDKKEGVRAMGVIFQMADGEEWRTAMNGIPMFIVNDPADFKDLQEAVTPDPETGKPDPAKQQAFFGAHPEALRLVQHMATNPPSRSFMETRYNSVNAFFFVSSGGARTPVRWSMLPDAGVVPINPADMADKSDNFLFEDLTAAVQSGPVSWTFEAQIGEEGDDTTDATLPWPADRKTVTLGTLTLTSTEPLDTGACQDENFDPMFLPTGVEASEDPILFARSAAYAVSFSRRYLERSEGKVAKPE